MLAETFLNFLRLKTTRLKHINKLKNCRKVETLPPMLGSTKLRFSWVQIEDNYLWLALLATIFKLRDTWEMYLDFKISIMS